MQNIEEEILKDLYKQYGVLDNNISKVNVFFNIILYTEYSGEALGGVKSFTKLEEIFLKRFDDGDLSSKFERFYFLMKNYRNAYEHKNTNKILKFKSIYYYENSKGKNIKCDLFQDMEYIIKIYNFKNQC